jgi:hypothetical protein
MVIDSHVFGVVKAPSSNTKKHSTRRVVNDNHPIQTVVQLASRNVPPLCNDSFLNQLETIRKHDEQNVKIRQQMVIFSSTHFCENTYLDFISHLPFTVFDGAGIAAEI